MAKQEKVFSFEDLNKKMKEVSDFGSIMSENEISTIDHFIHSGNYLLNAALTGSLKRGYPGNRSVAFAGPSGVGKTYLLLNGIRRAQQEEGYYTVFFDSENAVDVELMKKFGIDTNMVRYEPVNTVQEFRHISTVITEELLEAKKKGMQIPKILFVLDSAGNLATMKEVEDAKSGSEKSDMTRSKILKSIFRILMTRLGILKIPFWFSNHVYQTQDLFSKTIQGGGTGPEYAASIILFLTKSNLTEGSDKKGIIITAKPNKNRFAKPETVKFFLRYDRGMNPYVGLEKYFKWDICGIQRGKFISEKDFLKLKEEEKELCRQHSWNEVDAKGKEKEVIMYFLPGDTARGYCVKHLNTVVKPEELFTSKVVTTEVIEMMDEYVRADFEYAAGDADDNFEEILNEGQDEVLSEEELNNQLA